MERYVTSESVCIGHPDKVCDRISDSILDECLRRDPNSRVAVEALATKGKVVVAGEVTCSKRIDFREYARKALSTAGYNPDKFEISVFIHAQSPDISDGVDVSLEDRVFGKETGTLGAGDQGTVYGYATNETEEMLPLPILLSHRICMNLDRCRTEGIIKGIRSDGKAQVSMVYIDGKPASVDTIIISIQHSRWKNQDELRKEIIEHVVKPAFSIFPLNDGTILLVNPSGRFIEGGPAADTGLTGRKIIVDTYGGIAPHGGGAFSGKDPTKVDRSAAYMARHVAKHIVAAGLADRCTVSLSYAIGKANPVAADIDTHGTGKIPEGRLMFAILETFQLSPSGIIDELELRAPTYGATSTYGHFTNQWLSWERIDEEKLKKLKELTA